MAEYSTNYTQNTTDIALGTETYKFSRVVSTVNPSTMDNTCIYCGSNVPVKYDYYPTTRYTGQQLTLMNSKWNVASNKFNFTSSAKDSNFNVSFALCDYNSTSENAGINSVYQIGKTIYNETSSSTASNIRILNPTDIRKFLFRPVFDGYLGTSNSLTSNVDIKYLMEHPDNFYVTAIRMKSIFWNGTDYISTSSRLEKIRPCVVGDNYFLPLTTCLARHVFQTTDYNSRKAYTQSFYGAYDEDGMGIDFFPIESNEEVSFTQEPTTTNVITDNGNKYYSSYNYYVTDYSLFSPAKQVVKLLAYCGCYFIDSSYSTSGKNLNTFWNDEHIYLGEMLTGARTTGNFIKGTDLLTSDTINKGQYSSQTDFNPTPPGPGPGPYDDDPWSGVSFSGVGLGGGGAFARCYYMTSTELANLRSWMCGINVPEGFNPMAQIIGLSQVPVALSGDAPETVQFINSSAVYDPGVTSRVVDSNVSTQYSMGSPIKYSLGSVDIVRRMQERGEPYLDYSCQIELYLPLIGMFSLDTQSVMGRTIEAEAILDPISGTLAAYAWVSKDGEKLPIAYGSTTISVDLPVTAQQYSVSKAALKQANAQLGTSILSSVATLVAAAVGAGKAEGSNARVSGGASSMQGARGMNSYAQASSIAASQAAISQTGNIIGDFMQWGRTIKQLQYGNNTAISGSFGGSVAQWSYPFQAYVKINRPRYEKPENYAHTQGVPCVQKKRIGDCTGFIQCIGVDVDNHIEGATDIERQAIQAALSSGIYAGGGGE